MTITCFGNKDTVVVSTLRQNSVLGGKDAAIYTRPTLDPCFSEFGFAYPLSFNAISYASIMRGKRPRLSEHTKPHGGLNDYLLVDHEGLVWKVSVTTEREPEHSHQEVFTDLDGWWMMSCGADRQRYVGMLDCNPTEQQIREFVFQYNLGQELQFLKIADIAAELNVRFNLNKPIQENSDVIPIAT